MPRIFKVPAIFNDASGDRESLISVQAEDLHFGRRVTETVKVSPTLRRLAWFLVMICPSPAIPQGPGRSSYT